MIISLLKHSLQFDPIEEAGYFKMRIFLSAILLIASFQMAKSQDYRMGLGIRAGTDLGFTIKYFMRKSVAMEGIVATRWRGGIITGLLESHYSPFNNPDFKIYLGGGLHVGNWNGKNVHPWFPEDGISRTLVGFDGIAGIEYTFNSLPLNLGLDWKPSINLSNYKWVWLDNFGLSVRYTFK